MDTSTSVTRSAPEPLVALVRCHPEMDVQVAGRATARPDRATTGQPQGRTVVDTGRHVDVERALLDDAPLAAARRARHHDDLAHAAAARARARGDHLAEQALANAAHLARTVAVGAGDRLRPGPGSGAVTCGAHHRSTDRDWYRRTEHRLLEHEVGGDFEILAARGTGRAAVAAAESALAAEERIEEVAEATAGTTAAEEVAVACRRAAQTGLAETVVALPQCRVREHLVGPGQLLELLLGLRIVRVRVGVELPGALAVGALDLLAPCSPPDTEQLVEVSQSCPFSSRRAGVRAGR